MLDICFLLSVNSVFATTTSSFYNLPYKFYLYIFVYYYNKVGPANLSCHKKPEKFASPIGKDMNKMIEITKQLARFAK